MRPVDAPPAPPLTVRLLADIVVCAAALVGAWWLRAHELAWLEGVRLSSAPILLAQAAGVGLVAIARGGRSATSAAIAIVAGAAAGWFVLESRATAMPISVALAQAWLAGLGAYGWRAAWALRSSADAAGAAPEWQAPGRAPGFVDVITRHRSLLRLLVLRDLKLKYRGSIVGFFWSLANPIVMTVTYTLAFTYILDVRSEGFVFRLLIGLLAWTFFSGSASMATGAIVDSGALVRSIYFPRVILPTATVAFNFVQYLLALAVLLPFMFIVSGVRPAATLAVLPLILLLLAAFTLGVSLLMATATVAFRDVRHLLDISLQVLFWATPILYSASTFPAHVGALLTLSPVAPFIESARAAVYAQTWPTPQLLTLAVLYAAIALVCGLATFRRHEGHFAE